jgi:hypothetical protein
LRFIRTTPRRASDIETGPGTNTSEPLSDTLYFADVFPKLPRRTPFTTGTARPVTWSRRSSNGAANRQAKDHRVPRITPARVIAGVVMVGDIERFGDITPVGSTALARP